MSADVRPVRVSCDTPFKGQREDIPSVISSTSPLSPKHWANRHPPEPEGSSMDENVLVTLLSGTRALLWGAKGLITR